MKSFEQKKAELSKLKTKLAKAKITVFTSFARAGEKGLNVAELGNLKKQLRAVEGEFVVGKRTLIERALSDRTIFNFAGSPGLAFGYGEENATAKTLYAFSRKYPALKLFGALWGEQALDEKSFMEFAKLPSREVLLGRIIGLMRYPLSALANVLGQVVKAKSVENIIKN